MGEIKHYLIQLFSPPADPALLTYGIYTPSLVILSVLVASFSSAMGLQMAGQAARSSKRMLRLAALVTGSLSLGSGVWAMHFIGMLAFNLCTPVAYDPPITLLSMLPSIAASTVALSLLSRHRIGLRSLLVGGVLVGAGIGAMHYTGMAAMRSALQLRYDPWMFGLSIVVAIALATLALWVRFGLQGLRGRLGESGTVAAAGAIMGCAISGMHYTGMAAARFVGRVPLDPASGIANAGFLALAVTLTTALLTALVVFANGMLRYRALFHHVSDLEQALRASEEQLRSLVANIPGITFRCRNAPGWLPRFRFPRRPAQAPVRGTGASGRPAGGHARRPQRGRTAPRLHPGIPHHPSRRQHPLVLGQWQRGAWPERRSRAARWGRAGHQQPPADGAGPAHRQGARRAGRRGPCRLPGQYEPRDPHADEFHPRLHRRAAAWRTDGRAAAPPRHGAQRGPFAAAAVERHPRHRQAG
jgi:NO-binding membrane sensor protein with MHYT domain